MITMPSWLATPSFCTGGTRTQPGSTRLATGYQYLDKPPAEEHNFLFGNIGDNSNTTITAVQGITTELQNAVTKSGQTVSASDSYQLAKSFIAYSHPVGELIQSEIELTPAIWATGNATYLPVIARWDSDHDVTSTQAPDLVTAYRAQVAKINVAGVLTTSWTGTVSGSTITFASNASNLALLNMINEEGIANGFIATQTVGASALFTGTAQRCINVNGTDYPIAGCSVGGLTITVTGTPTSGSQTCIVYPYRIAGSSTSIRLPRISGFVGITAYDYDGLIVSGFRKMDRVQGHGHGSTTALGVIGSGTGLQYNSGSNPLSASPLLTTVVSDGTNGTPRTGKTTDPRTYGVYTYTWAGRLLA